MRRNMQWRVLAGTVATVAVLAGAVAAPAPGAAAAAAGGEVTAPQAAPAGRLATPSFGLGLVDAMPDSFFDQLAALDSRAPGAVLPLSLSAPEPVLCFAYADIALGSTVAVSFAGGVQSVFDFTPVVNAPQPQGSSCQAYAGTGATFTLTQGDRLQVVVTYVLADGLTARTSLGYIVAAP